AESPGTLEAELFHGIAQYGQTADADVIEGLNAQYRRCIGRLPIAARMRMLLHIIQLAEEQAIGNNAFYPFFFSDPAHEIVSSASLHAAGVWPRINDDPLTGVKELLSLARRHVASGGSEESAVAIVTGLLV